MEQNNFITNFFISHIHVHLKDNTTNPEESVEISNKFDGTQVKNAVDDQVRKVYDYIYAFSTGMTRNKTKTKKLKYTPVELCSILVVKRTVMLKGTYIQISNSC